MGFGELASATTANFLDFIDARPGGAGGSVLLVDADGLVGGFDPPAAGAFDVSRTALLAAENFLFG